MSVPVPSTTASDPAGPDTVIRVRGLQKKYGAALAVADVSFDVRRGEIFGLIGPNGAGKTTTMECVEGLRPHDGGVITVLGLDPRRDVYELQSRVGIQLQQAQLQKRIKVWEAIDLWASLHRKPSASGDRLLEQLGLANKRDSRFMNLSGGRPASHGHATTRNHLEAIRSYVASGSSRN
jgi:ABC-2 type transport system ATP-binding protein